MKLYSITSDAGETFFGGKTDAIIAARGQAKTYGEEVTVREYELMPGKAGIVALANTGQWALSTRIVKVMRPRRGTND